MAERKSLEARGRPIGLQNLTFNGLSPTTFIHANNWPQAAEGRCGYVGSNNAVSVERDSLQKENDV